MPVMRSTIASVNIVAEQVGEALHALKQSIRLPPLEVLEGSAEHIIFGVFGKQLSLGGAVGLAVGRQINGYKSVPTVFPRFGQEDLNVHTDGLPLPTDGI